MIKLPLDFCVCKNKAFTLAEGATHVAMSKNFRKCAFTLAEGSTHAATFNKKYSFGFTLAEVLITLGIIGVVAAMTMPTLIQNHQKTVYVTGVKKAINVVSNMLTKMQADDEASEIAYTTLISDGLCALNTEGGENKNGCEDIYGNISVFENLIPKYLNVVKTCKNDECDINYKLWCKFNSTTSNTLNCLENFNDKMTNSTINFEQDLLGVYTADGMIYYFIPGGLNALKVAVDTNGTKGPNQHGRDLFYLTFCMSKNGKFLASGVNTDWACAETVGSGDALNNQLMNQSPLYRIINDGWKMNY